MSKKGLRYVAFGKWSAAGTYTDGKYLSPAASLSGSANISDVKDYGDIIPGHGGVLDRFDSMLFTAPAICFALFLYGQFV